MAFWIQSFLAIPKLSATSDEAVHLAAGYSYWKTHDFRLNPEHPPLAKLMASLPLLWLQPKLDLSHDDWKTAAEYDFGFNFLYGNDADRLLFWSRAAMIMLASIGLLVTFLWARDLFGPHAGFFAAGMYAFCPTVLAHGMLVTTDLPLAALTTLTLYLFWKGGQIRSWTMDAATGIALGAAMASKFSGAFIPVMLLVLCLARDGRAAIRRLFVIGLMSFIVVESAYLFAVHPMSYFRNVALVNANHVAGYPMYLFGHFKPGGWWYYFLAAFLVKATLPSLLMVIFATVNLVTERFVSRWGEMILLVAIGSYFLLISAAADQVGVRYLLPIFPLIFVWTSRAVPWILSMRGGAIVICAVLAWQMWSAARAFPNYIPFFNEIAGGAAAGPMLLDDSNVDWGQGVKQAAGYVREHHLENVHLYTFSPLDNPPYYGLPPNIPFRQIHNRLVEGKPEPGVYIISAHHVVRLKGMSAAWQTYVPVDRIGESLWVYRF
jgi:hypothetical protein